VPHICPVLADVGLFAGYLKTVSVSRFSFSGGVLVDGGSFDGDFADLLVNHIADSAGCARAGQELVTVLKDAVGTCRDFGVMRNRLGTLVAH
jgi:hypothetical protein